MFVSKCKKRLIYNYGSNASKFHHYDFNIIDQDLPFCAPERTPSQVKLENGFSEEMKFDIKGIVNV